MSVLFFLAMIVVINDQPVDDQPPIDLTGIKCLVSGKAANLNYASEYKKGQVFFDCNSSRLTFEKDKPRYLSKANHQLVVTSQYVQTHCPIKSLPINQNDEDVLLAGVKLKVCCSSCRKVLISKSDRLQQMKAVFSDKSFNKTFAPVDTRTKKIIER